MRNAPEPITPMIMRAMYVPSGKPCGKRKTAGYVTAGASGRIPLDYMVVLDYWAIALIKYAKGKGISVEAKYIEVGYIEEKDTYLFDF